MIQGSHRSLLPAYLTLFTTSELIALQHPASQFRRDLDLIAQQLCSMPVVHHLVLESHPERLLGLHDSTFAGDTAGSFDRFLGGLGLGHLGGSRSERLLLNRGLEQRGLLLLCGAEEAEGGRDAGEGRRVERCASVLQAGDLDLDRAVVGGGDVHAHRGRVGRGHALS